MIGLDLLVMRKARGSLRAYQGHECVVFVGGRRTLVVLSRSRHTHAPVIRHVELLRDLSRMWVSQSYGVGLFAIVGW
jgi:hypothetical protein